MTTQPTTPETAGAAPRNTDEILQEGESLQQEFNLLNTAVEAMQRRRPSKEAAQETKDNLNILQGKAIALAREARTAKWSATAKKGELTTLVDSMHDDVDAAALAHIPLENLPMNLRVEKLIAQVDQILQRIEGVPPVEGMLDDAQARLVEISAGVETSGEVSVDAFKQLVEQMNVIIEAVKARPAAAPATPSGSAPAGAEAGAAAPRDAAQDAEEDAEDLEEAREERARTEKAKRSFFDAVKRPGETLGRLKEAAMTRLFGTQWERLNKRLTKKVIDSYTKVYPKVDREEFETLFVEIPEKPNEAQARELLPIILYGSELGYLQLSAELQSKMNDRVKARLQQLKELMGEPSGDEEDDEEQQNHKRLAVWIRLNRHRLQALKVAGLTPDKPESTPSDAAPVNPADGTADRTPAAPDAKTEPVKPVKPATPQAPEATVAAPASGKWEVLGNGTPEENQQRQEIFDVLQRAYDRFKDDALSAPDANHDRMITNAKKLLPSLRTAKIVYIRQKQTGIVNHAEPMVKAMMVDQNLGKLDPELKPILDALSS